MTDMYYISHTAHLLVNEIALSRTCFSEVVTEMFTSTPVKAAVVEEVVHTNVRDVRDVMSGNYGVVMRCTQYLGLWWSEFNISCII